MLFCSVICLLWNFGAAKFSGSYYCYGLFFGAQATQAPFGKTSPSPAPHTVQHSAVEDRDNYRHNEPKYSLCYQGLAHKEGAQPLHELARHANVLILCLTMLALLADTVDTPQLPTLVMSRALSLE